MSQWTASRSQQAARAHVGATFSAPSGPAFGVACRPDCRACRRVTAIRRKRRACGAPGTADGYTIAHAGRQVRFGPVAFWIAVGTVVIMAGWSITAATYLAFRDDVLRTLIAHQAAPAIRL